MKVIWAKLLNEPAVVLGLLTSVGVGYIFSRSAGGIDTEAEVLGTLLPFASSLGIRQLVTPNRKSE